MNCDYCQVKFAIIQCTRFLRHTKHFSHVPVSHTVDLCRVCYQKLMFERAYPTAKLHNKPNKKMQRRKSK